MMINNDEKYLNSVVRTNQLMVFYDTREGENRYRFATKIHNKDFSRQAIVLLSTKETFPLDITDYHCDEKTKLHYIANMYKPRELFTINFLDITNIKYIIDYAQQTIKDINKNDECLSVDRLITAEQLFNITLTSYIKKCKEQEEKEKENEEKDISNYFSSEDYKNNVHFN